jgi:NADH-quinone oxidoreductase subunit C
MSEDAVDALAERLRDMLPSSSEDATLSVVEPTTRGWNLDATVPRDHVVEAARMLDAEGFGIDAVTGVDWIAAGQMEIVYDFFHPTRAVRAVLRTRVPRERPEVPSIQAVFPGANWHERETHDFFGIRFLGHPDLTPLLLPEDADFHPLRKDYPGAS